MFTKLQIFISHVKLCFVNCNLSIGAPYIDTVDDISQILKNFEDSNEIKYTYLSDIPISDLCNDSGASPSLSNTSRSNLHDDSGGTTSGGTILISTTQDGAGKLVNTPITKLPMMG